MVWRQHSIRLAPFKDTLIPRHVISFVTFTTNAYNRHTCLCWMKILVFSFFLFSGFKCWTRFLLSHSIQATSGRTLCVWLCKPTSNESQTVKGWEQKTLESWRILPSKEDGNYCKTKVEDFKKLAKRHWEWLWRVWRFFERWQGSYNCQANRW